jgi:lipoyl(octanoyl) transferase
MEELPSSLLSSQAKYPLHERNFRSRVATMMDEHEARTTLMRTSKKSSPRNNCAPIWREKVSQWFYDVVDHIDHDRSIVYIAMGNLDRFLGLDSSYKYTKNEKAYRTAALTALHLAFRMRNEAQTGAELFRKINTAGVRVEEVVQIEKAMVHSLPSTRRPHISTPTHFAKALLEMLPESVLRSTRSKILEEATFLIEVSVCDSFFVSCSPSYIALASLIISIEDQKLGVTSAELSLFYQGVKDLTGLYLSPEVDALIPRLRELFSESAEACDQTPQVTPHLIPASSDTSRPLHRVVSFRKLSELVSPEEKSINYLGHTSPTHHITEHFLTNQVHKKPRIIE